MDMYDSANGVFDLDCADFHYDAAAYAFGSHDAAISGTALRRRLITPEALAAITSEVPKQTLLQRLLHR